MNTQTVVAYPSWAYLNDTPFEHSRRELAIWGETGELLSRHDENDYWRIEEEDIEVFGLTLADLARLPVIDFDDE